MEKAYFGGGCFWCIEASFRVVPGVIEVISGYAGGKTENPTYNEVSKGDTGHAEIIELNYNENLISYEKLLEYFFLLHDPTTLYRQGSDVGTQYRSIILFKNIVQKEKAENFIRELQKEYTEPIVTEVVKLDKFWPAEDYHQEYFRKNPQNAYCQIVVAPKVEKIERLF